MSAFIPYGRQSIDDADIAAVERVLRSDWLTQGPAVREFEAALAERCGATYAVAVCNGTAALHLAYLAAGVGPGDEVITSPLTFMATANAALYCGATPVFADVQPETGNIDPAALAAAITPRTRVVTPVHLNGHSADMETIASSARDAGLCVVEDAAHALGGAYRGRPVGSCAFSDMTIMSFHPVKLITTGEGGAITTNDPVLYEKLLVLREHGIVRDPVRFEGSGPDVGAPWYHEMQALGFNYRLTDLQSALGTSQLSRLDTFLAARRTLVARYTELLAELPGVVVPQESADVMSAWHLYPVRVPADKRREVFDSMRAAGIGVQVHYIPVHLQPYYLEHLGTRLGDYPNAEAYYAGEISLPLYPDLSFDEQDRVVAALSEALE